MKNNQGAGRGSQSRQPRPKSFAVSGLARSRQIEEGEIPSQYTPGKQAATSPNPRHPQMAWAGRVGSNPNPTAPSPTPTGFAPPKTFTRSPLTALQLYPSKNHTTSHSHECSLDLNFRKINSCLSNSFSAAISSHEIAY